MREEIFAEEIFAEEIFAILPFFAKLNSEKNEENSFNRKNKFRKFVKKSCFAKINTAKSINFKEPKKINFYFLKVYGR